MNIHENKIYLNQSCYNQPFISNPQVEIGALYIFDKQLEIINNEVEVSQIAGNLRVAKRTTFSSFLLFSFFFFEIGCAALIYHGARISPAPEPCLMKMGPGFGIQISDAPGS